MQTPFHNSSATTSVAPSAPNLQLTPQFISETTAAPLKRAEVRRRLWHMLPGLLPFVLAIMERHRPVPWEFLATIAGLAGLLTIAALLCYRTIARVGETSWALNALSFSAVSLPLLFLFPAHPELSAVVVTVLAFGDGSATLFGLLYGGQTLPWNASKTWVGFLSFLLCSTPLATLAYWTVSEPMVPFELALFCGFSASLIAQFVESIPARGTDNLRVGAAAIVGVLLAHTALMGWP